ncbi:MAG: hypothetical protein ABR920_08815 [Terriglobales bacterium]
MAAGQREDISVWHEKAGMETGETKQIGDDAVESSENADLMVMERAGHLLELDMGSDSEA